MTTLTHAAPITLFILSLFYFWFGVADRYAAFLYAHLGATPFDAITVSRYWMVGLVADGAVMVLYIAANALLGRIKANCRAPDWWRVWFACAPPLAVGIPLITLNVNTPTLPLEIAVMCVVVALVGLAFALMPGALAAHRPRELAWLALGGFGLMPVLILFRAIELPGKGLSPSPVMLYLSAFGSILFGLAWLVASGFVCARLEAPKANASALFISGLCWSYLLLPLAHHVLATPPSYKYITAASNFFASNIGIQLLAFAIAAVSPIVVTRFTAHVSRLMHQIRLLPFEVSLLS